MSEVCKGAASHRIAVERRLATQQARHQLCTPTVSRERWVRHLGFCWDGWVIWMEVDEVGPRGGGGMFGKGGLEDTSCVHCQYPVFVFCRDGGSVAQASTTTTVSAKPGAVPFPPPASEPVLEEARTEQSSSSRTDYGTRHRSEQSSIPSSRRLQRTMMLRGRLCETEIAGFRRLRPWGTWSTGSRAQITQCVLQHRSTSCK